MGGDVDARRIDDGAEVTERDLVQPVRVVVDVEGGPAAVGRLHRRLAIGRLARLRRPPDPSSWSASATTAASSTSGRDRSRTRRTSRRARPRQPDGPVAPRPHLLAEDPVDCPRRAPGSPRHAASAARGARGRCPRPVTGRPRAEGGRRRPRGALPALQPPAQERRFGTVPAQASAMSDHTHGGWMPPQEPSSSWRSMIHRSATASARSRPA